MFTNIKSDSVSSAQPHNLLTFQRLPITCEIKPYILPLVYKAIPRNLSISFGIIPHLPQQQPFCSATVPCLFPPPLVFPLLTSLPQESWAPKFMR